MERKTSRNKRGTAWPRTPMNPEIFEQSMLMMLPTASNLEEAKEMYIYVSSAAPIEELKVARDEACGSN